jgi:hypothetical protein
VCDHVDEQQADCSWFVIKSIIMVLISLSVLFIAGVQVKHQQQQMLTLTIMMMLQRQQRRRPLMSLVPCWC